MLTKPKDPLLGTATVLVVLLRIIVIFAMVMIGIGIGAMVTVGNDQVMEQLAAAGAPRHAIGYLVAVLALVMVLLALAHEFFGQLAGIIGSVGEGEPFRAENADRLSKMGWLSVAVHVLALILAAFSKWFKPFLEKAGHDADIGFSVELTGILLTLILFILARVFRRGAEMREELEGTV
jgi:MFS family permease